MHAALIVSEAWRVQMQPEERAKVQLADFMFEHKGDRDARARRKLLATLTAISRPKR